MGTFSFTATTQDGKTIKGVRSAGSRQEILGRLREEDCVVTSIVEKAVAGKAQGRPGFLDDIVFGKIKPVEIMTLTRQLAALLKAGISLTDAFQTVAHGVGSERLRKILMGIRGDVQRGRTLTEGMRKHPAAFDKLYVSMIHAGETSGSLAQNVDRLAVYLERKEDFRRRVKSATAYPKFVFGFFLVLTFGIFFFLIPKFKEIFEGFNAKLPKLTVFFMDLSMFLRHNVILIILAVAAAYVGFRFLRRSKRGGEWLDALVLGIPLVGKLVLQAAMHRMAVTLGTLLANGIPLTDALETCTSTLDNAALEAESRNILSGIMRGRGLSESMVSQPHFPRLLARMVHVGEESGSLSDMLADVAYYYEQEVDHALTRVTAIVEPLLICGLGVVALVTVIAIYLPVFTLGQSVSGGG